jgi:hypothetical protein
MSSVEKRDGNPPDVAKQLTIYHRSSQLQIRELSFGVCRDVDHNSFTRKEKLSTSSPHLVRSIEELE